MTTSVFVIRQHFKHQNITFPPAWQMVDNGSNAGKLEYGFSGKFLLHDMGFKDRASLEVGQIETVALIDRSSRRVGENG